MAFHDWLWLLWWVLFSDWEDGGWANGRWEGGGFQFSLTLVAFLRHTGGGWKSRGWARSGGEPFGLALVALLSNSNGGWSTGGASSSDGGELSLTLFTWLLSGGWLEGGRAGGGLELFGLAFGADHRGALRGAWGLGGWEIGRSSFEETLHYINCAVSETLRRRGGLLRFSWC